MKELSTHELRELCSLLIDIERLCKREYLHIAHLDPIKRIIAIADSNYQKADNILNERYDAAESLN